jgi:hypothetical protein
MANSMQKKMMDDLEKLAKNNKVEFVVNSSAANTGLAYFMQGWTCILQMRYNFQTGYCSIAIFRGNEIDISGSYGGIWVNVMLKYNQSVIINEMFQFVDEYVKTFTGQVPDGAGKP